VDGGRQKQQLYGYHWQSQEEHKRGQLYTRQCEAALGDDNCQRVQVKALNLAGAAVVEPKTTASARGSV